MDFDKDGKMTIEELEGEGSTPDEHTKEVFNIADQDQDGKLNREELGSMLFQEIRPEIHDAASRETFKEKDKNNDGKVSFEEFKKHHRKDTIHMADSNYQALDTNGDGHLDQDEMKQWHGSRWHKEMSFKGLFEKLDTDNDGHLSIEEFRGGRKEIPEDAFMTMLDWLEHLDTTAPHSKNLEIMRSPQ